MMSRKCPDNLCLPTGEERRDKSRAGS